MSIVEHLLRTDGTWYCDSESKRFLRDRYNAATMTPEDFFLAKAIVDADRERAVLFQQQMVKKTKVVADKKAKEGMTTEKKKRDDIKKEGRTTKERLEHVFNTIKAEREGQMTPAQLDFLNRIHQFMLLNTAEDGSGDIKEPDPCTWLGAVQLVYLP